MKLSWTQFKSRIYQLIHENSLPMTGYMHNSCEDLRILNYFKVKHRRVKQMIPIECCWRPPEPDELLLCCDGASSGNPGNAGAGNVARGPDCSVLGAQSLGLGVNTNYMAEIYAAISGLEWSVQWGFRRVLVRTDSASVVQAFINGSIPWFVRQRWLAACASYDSIRFEHAYREINFAADTMAKRGCNLALGITESYVGRPSFLHSVEGPGSTYYRFK